MSYYNYCQLRIPQKNLELRTKWLDALRRINYDPKDAFICEKHFTASDYEFNVHGNRNLKKGAVPSVFDFPVCPSKRTSKQIKPQQLTNVQGKNPFTVTSLLIFIY